MKGLGNVISAVAIILFLSCSVGFPAQSTDLISLSPGWNLVSLPVQPANTAIASVLSGINGAYEVVWAYPGQSWKVYDPNDVQGSTLTNMQAGNGYWIKMTSAKTLGLSGSVPPPSLSLSSGWNLVGYDGTSCLTLSAVPSSIPANLQVLWGYPSQGWQFYDPNDTQDSTLAQLCPGAGYWLNVSQAATWTPVSSANPSVIIPTGDNVLTITVDGSECSAATLSQWPNKPCVSITICDPNNPGNCQTVNDILLDTGDYGVRIFQQTLTQPGLLTALGQNPVQVNSLPVYECTEYGDGSSVWGPVRMANVVLAGEPAVQVPIQVTGSTTPDVISGRRRACPGAFSGPTTALYNGSLGLGLFVQDCGETCATSSRNGNYFTCSGGTCTGTVVPVTSQVQNPVASLPVDNNGVSLVLPSVPFGGSPSATGYLMLGIGTQSNNSPSGVVAYGANQSGNFTTVFNGASYESFIDSGSNGLFFTDRAIQTCSDWYCPPPPPAPPLSLSATTTGSAGSPSSGVPFQIANYSTLTASSNNVFSNIGGPPPSLLSGFFDWGLPFFLGRNVYVGIEGTTSGLGEGPYWAY
jgi:hypothetical protein